MSTDLFYKDDANDYDAFFDELSLAEHSLPNSIKKYWKDRHTLFEKFDEGIFLTNELWFSVTPELLAIFIAKFIKLCIPNATAVLDLFCGGGGNTIQFARFFKQAYAIDYNRSNIRCTLHNSEIYNVKHKVKPIKFDWNDISTEKGQSLISHLQKNVDVVFSSPPWGGPSYSKQQSYDLANLEPLGIEQLLISCFEISNNVCLFLPRNSNLDQLSEVTRKLHRGKCKVLFVSHTSRLKGILALWGEAFIY